VSARGRAALVTGGAGFIGSAVVRLLVGKGYEVVTVDKLTYSGNLDSLRDVEGAANHRFHQVDICDRERIAAILADERPDAIMHLAAESHVDRSIDGPDVFVDTNRSQEVFRRWLAMTRPAPGPGGLRRPLWLPRAFKPDASAYKLDG